MLSRQRPPGVDVCGNKATQPGRPSPLAPGLGHEGSTWADNKKSDAPIIQFATGWGRGAYVDDRAISILLLVLISVPNSCVPSVIHDCILLDRKSVV